MHRFDGTDGEGEGQEPVVVPDYQGIGGIEQAALPDAEWQERRRSRCLDLLEPNAATYAERKCGAPRSLRPSWRCSRADEIFGIEGVHVLEARTDADGRLVLDVGDRPDADRLP